MDYVCDAPDGCTWFRIATAVEAAAESALLDRMRPESRAR